MRSASRDNLDLLLNGQAPSNKRMQQPAGARRMVPSASSPHAPAAADAQRSADLTTRGAHGGLP